MSGKQKAIRAVNEALHKLQYCPSIPISEIDKILTDNSFTATEEAIYCGREGRSHEHVGEGVYLCLSWYKMPVTGRYEITAYVS